MALTAAGGMLAGGCVVALVVGPRRLAKLDATAEIRATAEASTKVRTAS